MCRASSVNLLRGIIRVAKHPCRTGLTTPACTVRLSSSSILCAFPNVRAFYGGYQDCALRLHADCTSCRTGSSCVALTTLQDTSRHACRMITLSPAHLPPCLVSRTLCVHHYLAQYPGSRITRAPSLPSIQDRVRGIFQHSPYDRHTSHARAFS